QNAHAGLASPCESRHIVDVHYLRVKQIARQRGNAFPVGRQHAPALPREELDLTPAGVDPEKAQAGDEGAVRNRNTIRPGASVKIEFVVSDEVDAFPIAIDAHTEPRVLRTESVLREVPVDDVVKRNAAEVGTH